MDLKTKDVSELLQVSEKTIRRWVDEGKIPVYRINGQDRFSLIEIENWLMSWQQGHSETGFLSSAQEEIFPQISEKDESAHKGGMQQFSLYRAVHKGGIFSNIPGETKEEIIRNTMKGIAPHLGMDADVLSDLLLDREELMPTALNHGIAVPHTRDFLLPGPFDMVVVVHPQKPIEYGALDGQPVHTLFFLFPSCDKRHLHLLAKLAHLSSNPQILELLKSKPKKEVLLENIRNWESQIRQS